MKKQFLAIGLLLSLSQVCGIKAIEETSEKTTVQRDLKKFVPAATTGAATALLAGHYLWQDNSWQGLALKTGAGALAGLAVESFGLKKLKPQQSATAGAIGAGAGLGLLALWNKFGK